jgi:HSP20 family protein
MSMNITKPNAETPARAESDRAALRPRVDVFENAHEYLVLADLPGAQRDAVDVHFEANELRIHGRRADDAADYRRSFALPDGVDAEKIEAKLANGVLEVHLPKAAAKRPHRIEIRAS